MYCHELTVSKSGKVYSIQCEDLARCSAVGIWPYSLEIDDDEYLDLLEGLREWASNQSFEYRLYTKRGSFESSLP